MNYGCPKGRGNFKPRCPGRMDVDTVGCLGKGRGYFQHPLCEGYYDVFLE